MSNLACTPSTTTMASSTTMAMAKIRRKSEEVDGEPDDIEGEECTNQGHRNGDGGDKRGAEVLEEEEHHEEHEHKGFDERLYHFMNRGEKEVVDVHDGANF